MRSFPARPQWLKEYGIVEVMGSKVNRSQRREWEPSRPNPRHIWEKASNRGRK